MTYSERINELETYISLTFLLGIATLVTAMLSYFIKQIDLSIILFRFSILVFVLTVLASFFQLVIIRENKYSHRTDKEVKQNE